MEENKVPSVFPQPGVGNNLNKPEGLRQSEDEMERIRKQQLEAHKLRMKMLEESNKNYPQPEIQPLPTSYDYSKQVQDAKVQQPINYNKPMNTKTDTNKPKPPASYFPIPSVDNSTQPYDIIPIPSEGKIYKALKAKGGKLKVAYMNAADENILVSPNIMADGSFVDILLKSKILSPEITDVKDMHRADRNAVLLWLRCNSFGAMYNAIILSPITNKPIIMEDGKPFSKDIDLSQTKIKKLEIDTDSEGFIDYTLPKTNKNIKIRLLTQRDDEELEEEYTFETEVLKLDVLTIHTRRLFRHIVEIEGNRDRDFILKEIMEMDAFDSMSLKQFVIDIEPDILLETKVTLPGGGAEVVASVFLAPDFWLPLAKR